MSSINRVLRNLASQKEQTPQVIFTRQYLWNGSTNCLVFFKYLAIASQKDFMLWLIKSFFYKTFLSCDFVFLFCRYPLTPCTTSCGCSTGAVPPPRAGRGTGPPPTPPTLAFTGLRPHIPSFHIIFLPETCQRIKSQVNNEFK